MAPKCSALAPGLLSGSSPAANVRLVARVGQTPDGQCSVMSLPRLDSGTKNGNECFPFKASARNTGKAVLALDYPESADSRRITVGYGICYPDGVAWMKKLFYRTPDGKMEMLNDILEACLKEANGKLQPLRYQYGILANTHMRYLRLKERVRLTEANIALADRRQIHFGRHQHAQEGLYRAECRSCSRCLEGSTRE